jgi:superfamily II DNA or RNA helicase
MSNQIYIIYSKKFANFKLGSTCNFSIRVRNYITCFDDFNNDSHIIRLYNITVSKFNCYQLDDLINKMSTKYSIPFNKYDGSGGTEFYKLDNFNKLNDFFDKIGIKYTWEQIDVDKIRTDSNQYIQKDLNEVMDIDTQTLRAVDPIDFAMIENLLKVNINTIKLKDYQIEMRNQISSFSKLKRLEHLIISPTGTGKTVIFSIALVDNIIANKKDVMILTKKKEILSQLPDRIQYYINCFINSKYVKTFEYQIVNCLSDCSTSKLNVKSDVPQIFICNWDKLTSSSNTKYKDVNWNKFGLIIIDESQWVGAPGIFDVMMHIKSIPNVNYIGFSATPIRCNPDNQDNTLQVFGFNQDFNILYEYTYYNALINKDICPIKYCPIEISFNDLVEPEIIPDNQEEEQNLKPGQKVLSEKSFKKVWDEINTKIIQKTHFKKGIFWFRTRIDMMKYYCLMNPIIQDFTLIPTMSCSAKESKKLNTLINDSKLNITDFNKGIDNFLDFKTNAILLAVGRATEGFDDDRLEFGIRMFYSNQVDPLNESQRMGRFNRWYQNNPNGDKKLGYYASLEVSDNTEIIRKSLIQRFKSWITFAKTYTNNFPNTDVNRQQRQKEIIELIQQYVDISTLNTYSIDIEKDIIASINNKEFDKYKIRNALRKENNKREEKDKIKTKSNYDIWAIENDFPICDELEEAGFNDFKFLFDLDEKEFLSWNELKKLCKVYQNKYPELKTDEIYDKMAKKNKNVPIEPEEIYKKKFTNLNDLFS